MGNFFAELRRRRIYRIGAGYVIIAWGITQLIDVLSQTFALPDWIAQPVLIVLAIGLPITLVVAWLIGGETKRAATVPASTVDWVLAGGLVLVLGVIGFQSLSSAGSQTASLASAVGPTTPTTDEIVEAVSERLPNSIAVLPFDNLSPDPDKAYFADGIHDEIINKLSGLQNVTVIARASVMRYAGNDIPPIPEIAEELNVETVMAGTVRYAGDEVRVTAQLIDGMTNVPVWRTEDNGDLSDIFAIQSDIAMNIANSLQANYSVEEQQRVEAQPTVSPEAYDLYLRAREIFLTAGRNDQGARLFMHDLLDQAIELDQRFAAAYVRKAEAFNLSREFQPVLADDWSNFNAETLRLAHDNLDKALLVDPGLAEAYLMRARLYLASFQDELAIEALDRAAEIDPNLRNSGQVDGMINGELRGDWEGVLLRTRQEASLDPNNSNPYIGLGYLNHLLGRDEEAVEALEMCIEISPTRAACPRELVGPYLALGDTAAALEALRTTERLAGLDTPSTTVYLAYGYGLAGQPDDARRVFEALETVDESIDYVDPVQWAWAHFGVGDYDAALNVLNAAIENPSLVRRRQYLGYIITNWWRDPTLDEPEWVDVRNRLRSMGS